MDNNEKSNPVVDLLGVIDQTMNAYIEREMIEAGEKAGDETAVALINLCREYGIRGIKLVEFVHKLGMIGELTGGKKED
jgi:hypothetical protein